MKTSPQPCEQELTTPEGAKRLSVSERIGAVMDDTSTQVTDLKAEVSRLKRELAEVRMECVILKQTVACFAKAQSPGTR